MKPNWGNASNKSLGDFFYIFNFKEICRSTEFLYTFTQHRAYTCSDDREEKEWSKNKEFVLWIKKAKPYNFQCGYYSINWTEQFEKISKHVRSQVTTWLNSEQYRLFFFASRRKKIVEHIVRIMKMKMTTSAAKRRMNNSLHVCNIFFKQVLCFYKKFFPSSFFWYFYSFWPYFSFMNNFSLDTSAILSNFEGVRRKPKI